MFRICVRIRIHGLTPRFSPRLGSFSHTPLAHLRGCPSVFAEFSRLKGGFIPTARCFFFGFIVKSPNVRINVRVFVRNIACQNRHWYEYVQIYVRICVRLYRLHVRVYVRVNTHTYIYFRIYFRICVRIDVRTHVRLDARMNVRICTRHHVCQKLQKLFLLFFA